MSEEKRLGRQTPTTSVVLPYTESHGAEAVEIYNSSGRSAQPWQELMLEDIMAVNDEGLWVHMKFGWSIPRRNGKSEILIMRSMYAVCHGERTLYTAHRTTTSHNAWEKVIERLAKAGYIEGEDFKTTKKYGLETIEWLKDGEGIINFRTRSSKGGLGEGYDLLVIDEAQEYTSDQESALKYVVTDSKNPQTLMCGTPPTVVSSGTVFLTYRKECLNGCTEDCGWAEWGVSSLTDAHDPELWYETNPSLGYILSERTIRSELGDDQVDDNIQRLGLWLRYNQKSAITKEEWLEYAVDSVPELAEKIHLFYGVKYAKNGNVSLSVAVKTSDGKIFLEAIDCRSAREGNAWIIAYLRGSSADTVAIDGAGNQTILVDDMKNAEVKCKPILPKVAEVVAANALFEQKLFEGQLCHKAQPALLQAASNSEHRAIGSGGGYGYSSILEGADVSLLESVSLAVWLCANAKERKKQIITY
ncbi:terminase large subunit [Ruminococcus sp.]|uniref:DEAD/DEAH box helicase family protein n=1 Tax=Ruminococcus sp. TaxID=41978 RepID=UPI001B60FE78|nr:terminase large subunit [Ruminococcus sp.]MBP5432329.1 terminase [Ruminococcus sp.]